MGRTRYPELISPSEQIVTHLKAELLGARRTILSLMPDKARRILESYSFCESRIEAIDWQGNVVDMIIALANDRPSKSASVAPSRAYCPLCGQGSSSPYERGYSLPEGLRRHLVGYGNMEQCSVMEATMKLANDYWHEEFHAAELAEQEQKEAFEAKRKTSEILYRIAPDREPQLIDDGMFFSTTPRNSTELAWAERRLAEGFKRSAKTTLRLTSTNVKIGSCMPILGRSVSSDSQFTRNHCQSQAAGDTSVSRDAIISP